MNEAGFTLQRQNAETSWRPPPELTRSSTPRPVRLTVPRISPWIFLFCFVLGLLFADASIELLRAHAFAQRVVAEGVVTSGEVTYVWESGGKTRRYRIGYRYQVDG